jgi:hypothetical protein
VLVVRPAWPPGPWRPAPPAAGRPDAAPGRPEGGGAIATRVALGAGAGDGAGAGAGAGATGAAATGSGAGAGGAAATAGGGGSAGAATAALGSGAATGAGGGAGATGASATGAGGGGGAAAGVGASTGAGAAATGAGAGAAGAGPRVRAAGTPIPGRTGLGATTRFFTTSTCTVLDRPWLKDWRTLPASTVLPSSRRPPGRRLSLLLPASCSFWSLIRRFEPDHMLRMEPPKHPATLRI